MENNSKNVVINDESIVYNVLHSLLFLLKCFILFATTFYMATEIIDNKHTFSNTSYSITRGPCMQPTMGYHGISLSLDPAEYDREDIVNAECWDLINDEGNNTIVSKRIIGMPGEHVEYKYNFEKGYYVYYINGEELVQDYVVYTQNYLSESEKNIYKYMSVDLGKDEYYLAGDNRTNSGDSRCYGPVKEAELLAKNIYEYDNTDYNNKVDGVLGYKE